MSEIGVFISESVANFKIGGGVKTALRRFAQTAPVIVLGGAGGAFIAGEMGPALVETHWTDPSPIMPTTPEYGPEWAKWIALIGMGGAMVEAVYFPFAVGRRIRQGELLDIPDIPHIGTVVTHAVRRGIGAIRGIPERRREEGEGISLLELLYELERQAPEIPTTLASVVEKIGEEKPPKEKG